MGLYRGFDVFSTAVRHFNCVPVEYLAKSVTLWEVLFDQGTRDRNLLPILLFTAEL